MPVGDDQRQHLELTRDIAERFNNRYGEVFTIPVGVQPPAAARVMDLQEPTRKMSKSLSSPLGSIFLLDEPSVIEKKIKKAVTDTDGEVRYDWEHKPGLSNLLEIFACITGETPASVAERYQRYGDLKSDLAAAIIEELAPVRARYDVLRADPTLLSTIAAQGAAKAGAVAGERYALAASAMGLV